MRLEDPETPSGSQLSPQVSNPSGIAEQRRQSSAWVTTGQHVEHRAINQVTTLTEPLHYIKTSPLKVTMGTTPDRFRRQQFQDDVAQEMRKSLCSYGGAIGRRATLPPPLSLSLTSSLKLL